MDEPPVCLAARQTSCTHHEGREHEGQTLAHLGSGGIEHYGLCAKRRERRRRRRLSSSRRLVLLVLLVVRRATLALALQLSALGAARRSAGPARARCLLLRVLLLLAILLVLLVRVLLAMLLLHVRRAARRLCSVAWATLLPAARLAACGAVGTPGAGRARRELRPAAATSAHGSRHCSRGE